MHLILLGYGTRCWDEFPNPRSGRELQVWGIAKELACRGHEVSLIKAGEAEEVSGHDGVDIISLPSATRPVSFQGVQTSELITEALIFSCNAAKVIEDVRPDALCLHYGLSSRYLSDLDIPRTYTFHVPDVVAPIRKSVLAHQFSHYPISMFMSLMEQTSASKAERLIVLNKAMENYIKRMWSRPAKVVPCGIVPADFADRGDQGYIMFAGRLDWNKNPEMLVRAYALLPPQLRKDHRLMLVGSGENEQKVRSLIRQLGITDQVDMIPWTSRENLSRLMGACSVFVLPSYHETFGIVLIEAMASGKPVIACDIPGPQDIIAPGINGHLIPAGDERRLGQQLRVLLEDSDLRKAMGIRGRREVEAKYSFQAVAAEYERKITEAISTAGSPPMLRSSEAFGNSADTLGS